VEERTEVKTEVARLEAGTVVMAHSAAETEVEGTEEETEVETEVDETEAVSEVLEVLEADLDSEEDSGVILEMAVVREVVEVKAEKVVEEVKAAVP